MAEPRQSGNCRKRRIEIEPYEAPEGILEKAIQEFQQAPTLRRKKTRAETAIELDKRVKEEAAGIDFIYAHLNPFHVTVQELQTIWKVIDVWDRETVKMVPLKGIIRVIHPQYASRMMEKVRSYRNLPKNLKDEDQKLDLTKEKLLKRTLFQRGRVKEPEILDLDPILVSGDEEKILLLQRKYQY